MAVHSDAVVVRQLPICPNPVFIIGSPRSGTSILAWSLAQHSQLWTSGELHILFRLFGSPAFTQRLEREQTFPRGWFQKESVNKREFLGFLGIGLNALFTSRSEGKRWIDQTPVNTLMVDVLAEMFPGAVFVHILRNGQRVVNSMINFANALGDGERACLEQIGSYPPWARDFRTACVTWRRSVEIATGFSASYPSRTLTVRYEQLVTAPEQSFTEVFRFLGLQCEASAAEYLRSTSLHSSYQCPAGDRDQQRESLPWQEWSIEQREIFQEEAGSTYTGAGYTQNKESGISDYHQLIHNIRVAVARTIPCDSKVIVVSKGDESLLKLERSSAQHFPQDDSGAYAGHHPANSEEAIACLEALRARGLEYLLIPQTSLWWLDHYVGFREHLDAHYRRIPTDPICAIYWLSTQAEADTRGPAPTVTTVSVPVRT